MPSDDFEVTVDPIDEDGNRIDPETGQVMDPDATEITGTESGSESSSSATINIQIVNANKLNGMDSPNDGLSFIMVDRNSNTGYLLDYNKLADTIYSKLYSEEMAEDSLKVYFID